MQESPEWRGSPDRRGTPVYKGLLAWDWEDPPDNLDYPGDQVQLASQEYREEMGAQGRLEIPELVVFKEELVSFIQTLL